MATLKDLKSAAARFNADVEIERRDTGCTIHVWLDEDAGLIWEATQATVITSHWFCGKASEQYDGVVEDISHGTRAE